MADENSGWISPRQRYSSPKRQRVAELRQKFEKLADKNDEHHKPGSSKDRKYRSDFSQGFEEDDKYDSYYRTSQNYGPSTEYSDSPDKFHPSRTSSNRSHGIDYIQGSQEYNRSINESRHNYGPTPEYSGRRKTQV